MTEAETIQGIRRAAGRRKRAEQARLAAVNELRAQARAAHAVGVPISRIAREAGLSRQGVYDLLAAERPA